MAAFKFQRSENRNSAHARSVAWLFASTVIASSSQALAQQTSATAAFPLVATYRPTPAPAATPSAAYAPTYTVAAAAVPPPAPEPPSGPPAQVSPYESPATATPAGPPPSANPALDRRDRAEKERERAADAWMLAFEGYTTAPVDIGGRVTFETPFRLRLSGAYGIVPGAYFGLVNDAVEESGAYDSFGADSVEASLGDGHVWRAMIGMRPVGGLYLDAGYAQIALSGGLQLDQFNYSIDTTIHMWTAEIGYQGDIADHLVVALGLGVMKTFSADSAVLANFELGNTAIGRSITEDGVQEYESKLEQYGIIPTVSLRIGWDFF
jgi:hypothetical protein